MEINTNFEFSGVNGAAPQPRPVSAGPVEAPGDQVSFGNSAALQQALANTPASRPEVVSRARVYVSNPDYPGSDLTSQMAQFLAQKLTENTE